VTERHETRSDQTGRRSSLLAPGRLEALIDGVSAIAITLLVIEISVPVVADSGGGAALADALRDLWPAFLAYLIGFIAVGIWWLHHHTLLVLLGGVDPRFVVLNLVFLVGIGFVPFTTGLLAEYMGGTAGQQSLAVAVFAGWQLFTAVAFNLAWGYAMAGARLLRAPMGTTDRRRVLQALWITPVIWAVILLLSLISAPVAIGLILASTVMWLAWVPTLPLPARAG
jgi:uncharacterized membrane protein